MFIINKPKKDLFYSMDKIGFEVKVIKNPLNANHVLKVINSYVCRGDQIDCNAFEIKRTKINVVDKRYQTNSTEV